MRKIRFVLIMPSLLSLAACSYNLDLMARNSGDMGTGQADK